MRRHRVREYFNDRQAAKMNPYGFSNGVSSGYSISNPPSAVVQETIVEPGIQQSVVTGGFFNRMKGKMWLTGLTTWALLHGVVALYHLVKTGSYLRRRRFVRMQMQGIVPVNPGLVRKPSLSSN